MSSLISSARWSQRSCSYPSYPDHGHPTPLPGNRPLLDWSHWRSASQKPRPITLHLLVHHRFGDTNTVQPARGRCCFCLQETFEQFRFCKSLILRFSEGRCPILPPNSHSFVGYREYSPLHGMPIFAKLEHSCFWLLVPCLPNSATAKCTKGSATLKIWDATRMCLMTSDFMNVSTSEVWNCLREQCANLLTRNKWTRNSSATIVTTHKSSSMTPFLIT